MVTALRRVLALLACLTLTGCGTLMPGAVGGDEDAGGPGSADTVKVVFVNVDLEAVKKITGFRTADVGDPEAQVQALEDWVNANGGVGGKELDAVFRRYEGASDSPAAEEQLCSQVTQDDRAFAVVLDGQFQDNARPCYADSGTLMLDATPVASDAQVYRELAPYLWSASFPEYDGFVRGLVATLDREGFFRGRDRVGVVVADTPVNRRVVKDVAGPLLDAVGVTPEVAWVDTTDQGTLFQGNDQAAVTFRTKRIDRVMFLGGARIGAIFTTVAAAQSFEATYAISSFDNPQFFANNPETIPPAALKGMVGIGAIPSLDLGDDQFAFPQGAAEKECVDIYAEAGIRFESREAARVALPYCDAARLLTQVADTVDGELTPESWGEAAATVRPGFASATTFDGGFRVLRLDDGCGCFTYEGGDVDYPAG